MHTVQLREAWILRFAQNDTICAQDDKVCRRDELDQDDTAFEERN